LCGSRVPKPLKVWTVYASLNTVPTMSSSSLVMSIPLCSLSVSITSVFFVPNNIYLISSTVSINEILQNGMRWMRWLKKCGQLLPSTLGMVSLIVCIWYLAPAELAKNVWLMWLMASFLCHYQFCCPSFEIGRFWNQSYQMGPKEDEDNKKTKSFKRDSNLLAEKLLP